MTAKPSVQVAAPRSTHPPTQRTDLKATGSRRCFPAYKHAYKHAYKTWPCAYTTPCRNPDDDPKLSFNPETLHSV